jgi:hypothetical protein
MIHELAISPERFDATAQDIKPFAVCKDDKPFKVGDVLFLREFETQYFRDARDTDGDIVEFEHPTGRTTHKVITYILDDPDYVKEGYSVLGLAPVQEGSE